MNGIKVLLILLQVLLLTATAVAQNYPTDQNVDYSDLIHRYPGLTNSAGSDKYKSSYNAQDSTARLEQASPASAQMLEKQAVNSSRRDSIGLFGYDLFARGGTTLEIPQSLALPDDYRLGPGDNLIIKLWGRIEQEYDLTVDRQGAIFIPKVGEIPVWGLDIESARNRINAQLSKSFSDFRLSVTLGKLKSIQVFVFGEVKYPGSYSVNSLATLFSTLYLAGGPTERGSLRQIRLLRNGEQSVTVDLYQFLLFGKNVGAVSLQSGDVIFVEVVGKRASITGAVKRPAIYEILGNETINDLLTLAGGPLPNAYLEKVRVDRITSEDAYSVIDLNLRDETSTEKEFTIEDGDRVFVEKITDSREGVVYLEGKFRHPGVYEYHEGLTVGGLLQQGFELDQSAYRGRIDILRRQAGNDTLLIAVDPDKVISGEDDVSLQPNDRLIAYSQEQVAAPRQVSIYGMVSRPGEYPYYSGMKVSDLIFRAGDLSASAYPLRVELARTRDDGTKEVLYASLDEPQGNLSLQNNDKLFVRQIPGWEERDMVTIEGEVTFPGKYVITDDMNSLYSLIQRAGGLTADAFATGTVFTRASLVDDMKRRGVDKLINRSAELVRDDSGRVLVDSSMLARDNVMSNRIIVNGKELLMRNNLEYDIALQDGDHIYIPSKPAGVQVLGAVPAISTITYRNDRRVGYYLQSAGGFLPNADKSHIQLIKADGTINSGSGVMREKVDLGDAIFVPTRIKKDRDWLKIFSTTASVAASLATTIFVIDRL